MKITDIYKIDETLDNPLPYKEIGNGRYLIEIDNNHRIVVNLITREVENFKLMSVLFRNPDFDQTTLTHLFKETNPIRVFSTISNIVLSVPNIDIIMFLADDIQVEIENKKLKLYQIITGRLVRQNKIVSTGTLDVRGIQVLYGIMPKSNANYLTDDQLIDLAIEFGIAKQQT